MDHKTRVLIFSTIFVRKNSHSKKNSARHYHKYVLVFLKSTRHFYQILMTLEYFQQLYEKTQIS